MSVTPRTQRQSYAFEWRFDGVDYNDLKEDGSVCSDEMECKDNLNTTFYLQIDKLVEAKSGHGRRGRITVFLHEMDGDTKCLENVTFELKCMRLKGYYIKMEEITFDCSDEGMEEDKNYQGEFFDIAVLERAFEELNRDHIEWKFTVTF